MYFDDNDLIDCDICGAMHLRGFSGDCRDDKSRYHFDDNGTPSPSEKTMYYNTVYINDDIAQVLKMLREEIRSHTIYKGRLNSEETRGRMTAINYINRILIDSGHFDRVVGRDSKGKEIIR